jgi:dTDP-L-rhamnose 4-epimerase
MGFELRILDNLEPRVHPKGKPSWVPREAEFIQGDVRDKEALSKALDGVHVVFHEAAYQDYMPDLSKFFHTNTVGTSLIYEVIIEKRLDIKKVIVASSQAVYGEGQYRCNNKNCTRANGSLVNKSLNQGGLKGFSNQLNDQMTYQPILPPGRAREQLDRGEWELKCPYCDQEMENLMLWEEYANPYNQYAISKYAQELVAIRLGKLHGIPTTALRYSITQGPRQSLYNQYSGICRIFSLRLLHNLPPIIYEDGQQKRDYVHISDVVNANMLVLEKDEANYEVFNVGSGKATTVIEYAEKLSSKLGKGIKPEILGEYRLGDNRHSVSGIEKVRSLGWRPRKSLDDIFDDYINWLRSMGDLSDYFSEAEKAMRASGVIRSILQY